MTEEDVAAIEYAVIRALRNFDTVIGSETHAMIRLALRQGRMLSKTGKSKGRTEYLSRIADSLIESRKKIIGSWDEVNVAVEHLQKTYKSFPVGHLESVTSARMKYECFIGRVSGLSDVLEGILQENEDSEESQQIIEKLSKSREDEVEFRKTSDVRPDDQIGSTNDAQA